MGKFKSWNDRGKCMNVWERRRVDPLYQFPEDIFYTTEKVNGNTFYDDLPKPDKYGIYHTANA